MNRSPRRRWNVRVLVVQASVVQVSASSELDAKDAAEQIASAWKNVRKVLVDKAVEVQP